MENVKALEIAASPTWGINANHITLHDSKIAHFAKVLVQVSSAVEQGASENHFTIDTGRPT